MGIVVVRDITSYFSGFVPILVHALSPRVWMNQEVTRDTDFPGYGDNCRGPLRAIFADSCLCLPAFKIKGTFQQNMS